MHGKPIMPRKPFHLLCENILTAAVELGAVKATAVADLDETAPRSILASPRSFAVLDLVLVGIAQDRTNLLHALGKARQISHLPGNCVVRFVVHLELLPLLVHFLKELCILGFCFNVLCLKLLDILLALYQHFQSTPVT